MGLFHTVLFHHLQSCSGKCSVTEVTVLIFFNASIFLYTLIQIIKIILTALVITNNTHMMFMSKVFIFTSCFRLTLFLSSTVKFYLDNVTTNTVMSFSSFTVESNIPDEFSPLIHKEKRDYVKYICALERQTEDLLYSPKS